MLSFRFQIFIMNNDQHFLKILRIAQKHFIIMPLKFCFNIPVPANFGNVSISLNRLVYELSHKNAWIRIFEAGQTKISLLS